MTRKLLIALLPVVACAGITPVQATPKVKTVAVSGTVNNLCSVSSPVGLTFTRIANGNGSQLTANTASLGYAISCNVKTSVKMQATALFTTTTAAAGESKIGNYTATLTPWGASTITATTAAPSTDPGTTLYPVGATAVSSGTAYAANGTVGVSGFVLPTSPPTAPTKWIKNQTYSASITLTLTVNN